MLACTAPRRAVLNAVLLLLVVAAAKEANKLLYSYSRVCTVTLSKCSVHLISSFRLLPFSPLGPFRCA